jgi:hypothetical protein
MNVQMPEPHAPQDQLPPSRALVNADRLVGAAAGIAMTQHQLQYDEAVDLLRGLSAFHRRPLDQLARGIVRDGSTSHVGAAFTLRYANGRIQVTGAGPGPHDARTVEVERPGPVPRPLAAGEVAPARLLDLLVETRDLAELIDEMVDVAVEVIPGCVCAGITVMYAGERPLSAFSDPRARRIEEVQMREGVGPVLDAVLRDQATYVEDVWERPAGAGWSQVAMEANIQRIVSLPIASAPQVSAALSIYATAESGWSGQSQIAGENLAMYIGDAFILAYRLNRRRAIC